MASSGLLLLIPCFFGIVALLGTIFWIWAIIDCASNEPAGGNDKLIWLLVVILVHFVGALIYYFVRRPERIRRYGR
jgi:Phospholipase_D-nuclease N-terminal